ncbi:MAG: glucose-6-phosphate isomerase [Methanomicrobiales archaeon]|nr:glucose-6-phosphate isomerase [Methanomicrobiales archaeon]
MATFWDGPLPPPQARTMDELRGVLADPGCTDHPSSLYLMYRSCARSDSDRAWLLRHDLRFDITVIPSAVLCGEYVKTKGHYHPVAPGGAEYPELYEVLSGTAFFLLQRRDCSDVVAVPAREDDVVFIPPGYGHVTINPGTETLVLANIVSTRFESDYAPYERHRGAVYYCMEDGWVANPAYETVPPLRCLHRPPALPPGLCGDDGIYGLLGSCDALRPLNDPSGGVDPFPVI